MDLPIDIQNRLQNDFGENYREAFALLNSSVMADDYLNHPRIIRCIVFLANKTLSGLQVSIGQAKVDKRDIMLLAEYINHNGQETPKRIRDFNNTFEDCEKNVKE